MKPIRHLGLLLAMTFAAAMAMNGAAGDLLAAAKGDVNAKAGNKTGYSTANKTGGKKDSANKKRWDSVWRTAPRIGSCSLAMQPACSNRRRMRGTPRERSVGAGPVEKIG